APAAAPAPAPIYVPFCDLLMFLQPAKNRHNASKRAVINLVLIKMCLISFKLYVPHRLGPLTSYLTVRCALSACNHRRSIGDGYLKNYAGRCIPPVQIDDVHMPEVKRALSPLTHGQ